MVSQPLVFGYAIAKSIH